MKTYKRYSIALTDDENGKLQKVKNHYKDTGVKKIFMGMVNAMHGRIPSTVDETQGDGVNKSGIMRNFPDDERNRPHSTDQATVEETPHLKNEASNEETE